MACIHVFGCVCYRSFILFCSNFRVFFANTVPLASTVFIVVFIVNKRRVVFLLLFRLRSNLLRRRNRLHTHTHTHPENPEHSLDNQSGRGGGGGGGGLWVLSPRCLVCSGNHGYRQSCPRPTFCSGYQNNRRGKLI